MSKKKHIKQEVEEELQIEEEVAEAVDDIEEKIIKSATEKEKLLTLYQTLKDLNVRSISDLENLIARA